MYKRQPFEVADATRTSVTLFGDAGGLRRVSRSFCKRYRDYATHPHWRAAEARERERQRRGGEATPVYNRSPASSPRGVEGAVESDGDVQAGERLYDESAPQPGGGDTPPRSPDARADEVATRRTRRARRPPRALSDYAT